MLYLVGVNVVFGSDLFLTNIASRLEEGHGADNWRFSTSVFSMRILKLSINIYTLADFDR